KDRAPTFDIRAPTLESEAPAPVRPASAPTARALTPVRWTQTLLRAASASVRSTPTPNRQPRTALVDIAGTPETIVPRDCAHVAPSIPSAIASTIRPNVVRSKS